MEPGNTLLDAFAEILLYPEQDYQTKVKTCIDQFTDEFDEPREMVVDFSSRVESLCLSEMEELYIKTFDLNKAGTLDLGWHLFGEDYNRGLFLVKLRQFLQFLKMNETTELPDHVSQVLRILGRMSRDEANQFAYACVIPSLQIVGEGIQEENPHDRLIQALILLLKKVFDAPEGFDETVEIVDESPVFELPIIT